MPFEKKSLLSFLVDSQVERVGLVLRDGTVVELENVCENPAEGFEITGSDYLTYEHVAVASWHTHPASGCNLSMGDMQTYLNYPELRHYIAGTDGVAEYFVEAGKVLRCED